MLTVYARSHAVTRKSANVAKAISHLCWSRSLVNPSTKHEVSRLGVLLVMMRLTRFTGKNVLTTSQPEYRSPCQFGHPSTADSLLTRGAAECTDSPSPGKAGRRGQYSKVCAMIRESSFMTGGAATLEAAYSSSLNRPRTNR